MAKGTYVTVVSIVEKLGKSPDFLKWKKANGKASLSSLFCMVSSPDALDGTEWLLSYYDAASDEFTTFSSTGSQKATHEQAFKEGNELPRLDPAGVKVEAMEAIASSEKVRKSDYAGNGVSRMIVILQPLSMAEVLGQDSGEPSKAFPVWNITYVTSSYSVINVKVSGENGKVLRHSMSGVMDFMQKDK